MEQVAVGIALHHAATPALDIHAISRKVFGQTAIKFFGLHASQIGRTQLGIADLGQHRGHEGDPKHQAAENTTQKAGSQATSEALLPCHGNA